MQVVKFFIMLTVVCLSACGTGKKVDYLDARNGKSLVVKPPLSKVQISDSYVLANIGKVVPPNLTPPMS